MYRFFRSMLETEEVNSACKQISGTALGMIIGVTAGLPLAGQAQPVARAQADPDAALSADHADATKVSTLSAIHARLADETITEGTQSYTTQATRAGTGLALSVRETPQSVSVITRQRIEDQNMMSVKDVMAATPGVSVRNLDSERYSFYSRGFFISNYLYDGIPTAFNPQWSAGESQIDPIIYDRVEVVRGATGLLTGAGNPSAAVNLVRKRADRQAIESRPVTGCGLL